MRREQEAGTGSGNREAGNGKLGRHSAGKQRGADVPDGSLEGFGRVRMIADLILDAP